MAARCNAPVWSVHDVLRSGRVLAVWRLDRRGRSLKHLIELMPEPEAERIGFQSVAESIDTTTLGGKLLFHIIGGSRSLSVALSANGRTQGWPQREHAAGKAAGEKSLVKSSVPWPSICTVRRNIQLTKFARRSASQRRRFTSMSRRSATDDDRSGACGGESADSAGYHLGASVLPTLRSM